MRTKAKVAASALLAAGLIAGCAPGAGVAATVNGEKITTSEVDDGMELGPFYAEPPAPADILASLIQARALIDAGSAEGIGASPADGAEFLDSIGAQDIQSDGSYPDAVLDLARMNIISQQIQSAPEGEAVIEQLNDFLASADIEFNPRYGTWDLAQGGVDQSPPEWIALGE